jgi:hypothetical protein
MIEAKARHSESASKGRAFPFVHYWMKVRHSQKFMSLHGAMNQTKRTSMSSTPSKGDKGGDGPTPNSFVPPAKRYIIQMDMNYVHNIQSHHTFSNSIK